MISGYSIIQNCLRLVIFLTTLLVPVSFAFAQEGVWQGKKCAVALTYDDALNVQLDNVIPLLDSLGLSRLLKNWNFGTAFSRK